MDQNDSRTQKMSDGSHLPHSLEDLKSLYPPRTIFATHHCVVGDVYIEKGSVVKDGDPLFILEQATMPKSTRSTQSDSQDIVHSPVSSESLQSKDVSDENLDYAQPKQKQKVNDIGPTKQMTITAIDSWRVAELMVAKGKEVKPWEPLYAIESLDIEDVPVDVLLERIHSDRKRFNKLMDLLPQ